MTDDIIDLSRERAKREGPDEDCVRRDQDGREMFLFALQYKFEGRTWAQDVWAYSWEDAEARVAAMRESLAVLGQTYSVIPG